MYEKILVPIDGSTTAKRGLLEALHLARRSGSRVRILHVVEEGPTLQLIGVGGSGYDTEQLLTKIQSEGEAILENALELANKHGVKAEVVKSTVITERSSDAILDEAYKWKPGLIVMGTHGRKGVNRLVFGSDAELVVRNSPVPVLLVRLNESRAKPKSRKSASPSQGRRTAAPVNAPQRKAASAASAFSKA